MGGFAPDGHQIFGKGVEVLAEIFHDVRLHLHRDHLMILVKVLGKGGRVVDRLDHLEPVFLEQFLVILKRFHVRKRHGIIERVKFLGVILPVMIQSVNPIMPPGLSTR